MCSVLAKNAICYINETSVLMREKTSNKTQISDTYNNIIYNRNATSHEDDFGKEVGKYLLLIFGIIIFLVFLSFLIW